MQPCLKMNELSLGVCYYPEHWPESMWEEDFTRMAEYGIRYVRMGEFAWTLMEPREGEYDFSLFDRAMDAAHRHGLKVVFGTPTATPPVWLTQAHPEILNASRDGVVFRHGMRRHYNYTSPAYLEYTEKIVSAMASHFKDHPALWAWQIDNELNCEISVYYAESDHKAFREWCRKKYGTLDALNEAWGTVFWNQIYTDWEDVSLPLPTVTGVMNPHQGLDMRRFISDVTLAYAKLQSDVLRRIAPDVLVTTNGMFGHMDNVKMTKDSLDFYCYDSYPIFAYGRSDPSEAEPRFLDRWWSKNLSLVRGICPVFAIMEQQAGPGGSLSGKFPAPKPGQMRLWAWQSVAHGADLVSFFRWRTAVFGTEIYWHGLLNYGSRPNRRTDELQRLRDDFSKVSCLAGANYQAKAAVLKEYGNDWDGEYDVWHGPLTRASEDAWFKAAQKSHIPLDFLYLEEGATTAEDLARYDLLVFPHAAVFTDWEKALLETYVRNGGTLILGARSGYKDEHGHIYRMPLPGKAADLAGVLVKDFTAIGANDAPGRIEGPAFSGPVSLFSDILEPMDGTDVLASFTSDYYAGEPALTCAARGAGRVFYFGSAFTDESAACLLSLAGLRSPACGVMEIPETVELAIRQKDGLSAWILLNYPGQDTKIRLLSPMKDLLSGDVLSGDVTLPPYDVKVLVQA